MTICFSLIRQKNEEAQKDLIDFIDKQIIDSLVYELYLKEELKTQLVEPYLKNIENLKSDDDKLKIIKQVAEKIKVDSKITKEINSYKWVRIIEGKAK